MKVFLSHGSPDKWLARRIAADIAAFGAQTFLDEKDIATGESIDSAIQANLSDCHDFLILLSPASIKSDWVLVELGGALALKKNVIPVLLYLGPNDIPKPISKLKGRDIGDIEKYYEELKNRLPKHSPPLKPSTVVAKKPKKRKIKRSILEVTLSIGDSVVLPESPQQPAQISDGKIVSWKREMDQYCGLVAKVTKLQPEFKSVHLDVDQGKWFWAKEWLAKKEG